MRIRSIYIENFRGIDRFEISDMSNLNLLSGANGSGKSSVLTAVKILLSWLIARIKNAKGRGLSISERDISIGKNHSFLKIVLSNGVSWQIYKQKASYRGTPTNKTEMSQMSSYANKLAERLSTNPDSDITLIDAYGVNRVVDATPMRVRKAHRLSPLDAISMEMSNSVNFHDFFIWFREMEDIENENMRNTGLLVKDKKLEAVRQALARIFDGYDDFKVQRSPKSFKISKNGQKLDFCQLSDGEKSFISLILDIARKLAMTHPSLDNPLEGDGIILIDEIDLHLHPGWQLEALGKLRETFPNCQFIVSTHSPHVVSCVNRKKGDVLISMTEQQPFEIGTNLFGQESDSVLAEVFRMKSLRNTEVQDHLDNLWSLLSKDDCESDKFKAEYDWLKSNVDASDSMFTPIRMQMAYIKQGLSK